MSRLLPLTGSLQSTALKMAAKTDIVFLPFLLGVSDCPPESSMKAACSMPQSNSQLKSSNPNHASQHAHLNGNHLHFTVASSDTPGSLGNLSDEEEEESGQEEEDEDEEEMEEVPKKWQGIEAIFEAYQDYADGEFYVRRPNLHVCQGLVNYFYEILI